ncbi:predicted protein [Naegleria gruberi]|uniref:Predicted protein n=1 Tax=Naegleria gruberi TaxID=5762 RepID=D2V7I8_NAEGR|nr:uncharacterized protein NAEGRDRAFT_64819 [Naegleria gruberi]EFC47386.1 predicted protein [Naegleria gruberi]|eukprot:XP_002680130.1 predicted protein [Naegleria gruberi strain NEG-M]
MPPKSSSKKTNSKNSSSTTAKKSKKRTSSENDEENGYKSTSNNSSKYLEDQDDSNIIDEYEEISESEETTKSSSQPTKLASQPPTVTETKIKKEIEPSRKKTKLNDETTAKIEENSDPTMYKIVDAHTGKTKLVGPKSKISSVNQLKHYICEIFKLKSVNEIESIRNLDDKDVKDADLDASQIGKSKANTNEVIILDDINQSAHSTRNLPPTSSHGCFILTLKNGQNTSESSSKVKANLQLTVDIVPHVNILIHGGDEYDFITALAEILDNSIQNTVLNKNERLIEIRFEKPTQSNELTSKLHIWDNGRGMNFKTLVNWATLGITEAPVDDSKLPTREKAPLRRRFFDKFVTSDFSRYGVGSKKAIFNLGDEVTLVSKPKDSRFVYEVSLSRQKLEQDFTSGKDKQWKANCISRPPTDTEKQWESFTHFTISDIKKVYVDRYDPAIIKKRLGHIYHYYIHGTDGNKEGRDIIEDPDENDNMSDIDDLSEGEEEEMPPIKSQKKTKMPSIDEDDLWQLKQPKNVIMKVDGTAISNEDKDMETLYLQEGKSPFTFEIKLSVKNGENLNAPEMTLPTSSQYGVSIINSTVRGIIYYYPFKQGRETLPIPEELYLEGGKYIPTDQEVPLSERNPGFECFWNGRLLANEKIKNLPFMEKERSNRDIPENCYRRIKGMLFFDSNFEVSANKMYLCKQTALCQALLNYSERNLTQRYRKWIKECHKKLDEEIIFDECDFERTQKEGKGMKTFYKKIKYGQTNYSIGDYLVMKTRPKIIGTLVDMFRDMSSEEYSVTIVVKEWSPEKESDDSKNGQCFPISKVQNLLTKQEFKAEVSKMKNKLPSYIDVVDTPNVTARERRPPPDAVTAGYSLKYLSACIMTGDHKVVTNQLYPVTLTITYEGDNEEEQKLNESLTSTKAFKKGVHCFKPYKLKPEFTSVGTYILELSSSEDSGIKAKVVKIDVTAAAPSTLSLSNNLPKVKGAKSLLDKSQLKDSLLTFIDKPFPTLIIEQQDTYGNVVPFKETTCNITEELKITTTDDTVELSSFKASFNNSNQIEITELVVKSAPLGSNKFVKTKLVIAFGLIMQPLEIDMVIFAGAVHTIQLSEDAATALSGNSVKKILPDIEAKLLDEKNNQIYIPCFYDGEDDFTPLTITVKGECLKEEASGTFNTETGYFQFKNIAIGSSQSSSQRKEAYITLSYQDICIDVPLTIESASVAKPSSFNLLTRTTEEKNMIKERSALKVTVNAIVSSELVGWNLELCNEMYERIEIDAYARASWCKANLLEVKKGICELPTLVVPQIFKTTKYFVDILSKAAGDSVQNDDDIDTDMIIANFTINLRVITGPPCIFKIERKSIPEKLKCEQKFSVKFSIMDAFGNRMDNESNENYPELENIEPSIEIVSQLNGEAESIEICDFDKLRLLTGLDDHEHFKFFKYNDVSLIGPSGEFHLKIIDKGGKIKEGKIENILLEPGPPVSLRVNDMIGEVVFDVENYNLTPSFYITTHDKFGNVIHQHGNFEIEPPETDIEIIQYQGEVNQSIDLQIENGRAYMPQFWVKGTEGRHTFWIEYELTKANKTCFIVNIIKSSHPAELKVTNKTTNLVVGDFLDPFEVVVLGESGKPVKAPNSIIMEVANPQGGDKRQFISCPSASKSLTYTFANSEKEFTKSGVYRYRFTLDISSLPYVPILGLNGSINTTLDIAVSPGDPEALEIENDKFQLPVVTNMGENIDARSFWEELSLKVIDKYSNTVIADDKIKKVTLSIQPTEDSMDSELPELEGDLVAKFENGRAKFSRVSIKEGSGETGLYKLVFTTKNLPPKELEFGFTDNSAIQQIEKELQEKKQNCLSELDYLKKEIKKAEQNHQENEFKLSNFRSTMNDILKTIKEYELNFENDMPNMENADKLLNILKKKLEIKTQNSRKQKECNVGLAENKALQKVKQLQKETDSGIVGILGELGYIDNEKHNDTISRFLGDKMQCIVVQDSNGMEKVRRLLENFPHKIPVLPLDNIQKCSKGMDNEGRLRLDPIDADGFVGYSVNLIEIDIRREMIRHAFWNLLGSSLVFETFLTGLAFRKKRLEINLAVPLILTLDGERIEATGIVYAGSKATGPPVFRFGQTPLSENPEVKLLLEKKKKVEEYKKVLRETIAFEKGEYAQTEQQKEETIEKHKSEIEEIQGELENIDEELRNLKQGLSNKKGSPKKKKTSKKKKTDRSPTPSSPVLFSQKSQKKEIDEDDIEECSEEEHDDIEEYSEEEPEEEEPKSKKRKNAKKTGKSKKAKKK